MNYYKSRGKLSKAARKHLDQPREPDGFIRTVNGVRDVVVLGLTLAAMAFVANVVSTTFWSSFSDD
jgi:hypothetical protein